MASKIPYQPFKHQNIPRGGGGGGGGGCGSTEGGCRKGDRGIEVFLRFQRDQRLFQFLNHHKCLS